MRCNNGGPQRQLGSKSEGGFDPKGAGGPIMAGLTRYTICDDYTIQELTRDYSSRDSAGRLELLKQLAQNKIPTEIGLLAVQDANPMVRQWMARYGDIKYNRSFHRVGDLWINEKLEPDLYDRLRTDPDAFVRASLLENPHVTFWHADDYFEEATQLERLALMHNVETVKSKRFLLKLFNVADTELDIGLGERSELIVAFFSNEALSTLHADTGLVDTPLSSSRYSRDSDARKLLRELWELAAMWSTDHLPAPAPELTFRYLLVDPETRARVYKTVSQPLLRRTIIEGCSKTDVETLKMAIRDSDEDCRGAARSVCYDLDLDKLLEPEVAVSISGLSVLKGKIEAFVRRHELLWPD